MSAATLSIFAARTTLAQSTNDVPPLLPALTEIPPTVWEQHGVLIVVLGIVGVALLAAAIWWLLKPKPTVPVPIEIQTWRELTALSHELDSSEMLTNLSRCLRRYFSSAFGLPAEGATTTDFNRALATNEKVGDELAAAVIDFLSQADEIRFTPGAKRQAGFFGLAVTLFERGEKRRAELQQAKMQ